MIAPPEGTFEAEGTSVHWVGPETAEAVLEVDLWHTTRTLETLNDHQLFPDVDGMAKWCAAHAEWIEVDDRVEQEVTGTTIDACLNLSQIFDLKNEIVEAVSLPDDLIEQLRDYWKVALGEGCSCPICEAETEQKREELLERAHHDRRGICKYAEFDDRTQEVASAFSLAADDDLHEAPFYLYQIGQAYRAGKGDAMEQQRKKREKREKARRLQRQHGYT